jgi:hypothetical protein
MNVFAPADVMSQILQQDRRFLPVFLGDGAGKRVNLGWIRAGAGLCVANCCSRGVGLVQSTKNRG